MIETVFHSDDLPTADRFDRFRELMSLGPAPMDASSDHSADLWLYQRDIHLDPPRVWTMTFQPMAFHRTAKLIRQSDPETYNVCLLLNGTMGLTWGRREATYNPHDLHTMDFSQPFELRAHSAQGLISCAGIEIPKRLLPLPRSRADRVVGRPVSGREGIGALLAQFLTRLTADTNSYRTADGPRLGLVAIDLASALFAHIAEEEDRCLPPETQRRTLILRIRTFIQQHLADPHLTPGVVAAAHHISTSYLHRLFQDEPLTVTAWIRHQRMERARGDLADHTRQSTPIHSIAARWGFPRPADFTRAFRAAYGIAPKDYRHQALRTPE